MGIIEVILIGIALSMDAFAVSVCKGLAMKLVDKKQATVTALSFGLFQGLMPLAGWILGASFNNVIKDYDHWVAFGLLLIIGGNMIYGVIFSKDNDEMTKPSEKIDYKELFVLSVATSIDALAVGVAFASLGDGMRVFGLGILPSIILVVTVIAIVTFIISFSGFLIGNVFGKRFQKKAELAGGIILIAIGVKILLEHLNIL